MKYVILFLFLFFSLSIYSQVNTIIECSPNSLNQGKVQELLNGEILVNNYIYDKTDSVSFSRFLRINKKGRIVNNHYFNFIIDDFIEVGLDSIIIVYDQCINDSVQYTYCALLDYNYNVMKTDSIMVTTYPIIRAELIKHNNEIFFYRAYHNNPGSKLYLGQISKDSKFSEFGLFNHYSTSKAYYDMLITPDSTYNLILLYGNIIKINREYDFVDVSHLNDTNSFADFDMEWYCQDRIIIGGRNKARQMIIKETDNNFNVLNSRIIDKDNFSHQCGIYSNIICHDSLFYFIGTNNFYIDSFPFSELKTTIHITCFDSNFELIWEKEYGGDAFYTVFDVGAENDGGLIILSTYYNSHENELNGNSLHLLRLDANGEIITNSIIESQPTSLKLYPNPAQDFLHIVGDPLGNIEIFNSNGQINNIINKDTKIKSIDVSNLKTGIYVLKIKEYIYKFIKE